MMEMFQFLTVLTAVLFTGAAIYINLVEHPARMECGTELAATVFGPSYKRAARMQVVLALTATIAGALVWLMNGGIMWLIGALCIFAVVPFTLIIIMPVNNRLLDPGLDRASAVTRDLLRTWGKLHAVRSILSLVASIIFLWLLIRA
jgi:hypothetical protein